MEWPAATTDITIVGGGIVGLTTAYTLCQRARAAGTTPTIRVVEQQSSFGAGSTTRAGCGIRTFYKTQVNQTLAQLGLRFWNNADHLLQNNHDIRETGYLFLTNDDETATALQRQAAAQRTRGNPATYMAGQVNAPSVAQGLRAENYAAGVYTPDALLASPRTLVESLVQTLERYGTELRTDEAVRDIEYTPNRVTLTTTDDTIHSDVVVNAAGGWAEQVAALVGEELPISLQARRLARLDEHVGNTVPLSVDLDTGVYILSDQQGQLLAGGKFGEVNVDNPSDATAFNNTIDKDWNKALRTTGESLHDALASATIDESWTGLYAMTKSRRPIIERSGQVIHATGFSGHGIMQAPGAAQVIADLVCDTNNTPISKERLQRDRPAAPPDIQF